MSKRVGFQCSDCGHYNATYVSSEPFSESLPAHVASTLTQPCSCGNCGTELSQDSQDHVATIPDSASVEVPNPQ